MLAVPLRSALVTLVAAPLALTLSPAGAEAASAAVTGGTARASAVTVPAPTAVDLCNQAPAPGHASCFAEQVTNVSQPMTGAPAGYGPADLQSAYQLPADAGGMGETVYVVDAYDNPHAEADLALYRSQYGLAPCTTANGCFAKLNQSGVAGSYPVANSGWAMEISLDIEMVSAACPNCRIRLIEANDNGGGLYTAVQTAIGLGAKFVSMSWGGPEWSGETSTDGVFEHPGVLFAASTGDNGYAGGVSYPAASPDVLAVGGTRLVRDGSTRGWSETAWGSGAQGAGSGCSAYEPKPLWQASIPDALCVRRGEADVSAVADPGTGLAVASNGGWTVLGGTSASAPLVAAMYALAGDPGATDRPQSYPYSNSSHLADVTGGSTGSCGTLLCTAGAGWDGPTGLGTPLGIAAFSGTGSDTPVVSTLGGRVSVAAGAVAGLPTAVSATTFVPTGRTLASVTWRSTRSDCTFADPHAATTTVSCNAGSTATSTLTAALVDSSGATANATATLTFAATPTVKRPVAVALSVDHQTGPASVCTADAAPVVGTVVDLATGQPVQGLVVTLSRMAGTATTYSVVGSGTTLADGTLTRPVASTASGTLQAASAAAGAFAATTAPASDAYTVATCTPSLAATSSASTVWYGTTLSVSGHVTRTLNGATLPVSGASVVVKVGTATPAKATTAADGSWSASFAATSSGALSAAILTSASFTPTAVDLGQLTVRVPTTTLSASISTTTVPYGNSATIAGTLTKTGASTVPLGSATVVVRLLKPGTTTPVQLATTVTKADGSFSVAVPQRATGALSVVYAGGAAQSASSADLGTVTVVPWTPTITAQASATTVTSTGTTVVSGQVTGTANGVTQPLALSLRVVLHTATGSEVLLASPISSSTGAFSVTVVPRVSGTITVRVVDLTGYANASSPGVGITVS